MTRRSRGREVALQVLYQVEQNSGVPPEEVRRFIQRRLLDDRKLSDFTEGLIAGVKEHQVQIDALISQVAENWRLDRMAAIDRNILRLGAYEMLFCPEVPAKVAINEALELAKRYSTAQSSRFVNGILDRMLQWQGQKSKTDPANEPEAEPVPETKSEQPLFEPPPDEDQGAPLACGRGNEMAISSLLERFKKGLAKTAQLFNFRSWFGRKVDQSFLDDLENRLIKADVGLAATSRLIDRVREAFADKTADENLLRFVKNELKGLLEDTRPGTLVTAPKRPSVYLIAGVNGSGKTTSIAKLAQRLKNEGKTILLAACDTFRAAAADQLSIWATRAGCEIVKGSSGADPASVAHDACQRALARNIDVLIVDTAGRLHTQSHLMRELEKIRNVIQRLIPGAPHEVLLVIDATNGQNAIRQAEVFTKSIGCTGVILTKLDGTAKGGVVVAVRQTMNLPVKFIGVGEALDDLQPFDADTFVESLFM